MGLFFSWILKFPFNEFLKLFVHFWSKIFKINTSYLIGYNVELLIPLFLFYSPKYNTVVENYITISYFGGGGWLHSQTAINDLLSSGEMVWGEQILPLSRAPLGHNRRSPRNNNARSILQSEDRLDRYHIFFPRSLALQRSNNAHDHLSQIGNSGPADSRPFPSRRKVTVSSCAKIRRWFRRTGRPAALNRSFYLTWWLVTRMRTKKIFSALH